MGGEPLGARGGRAAGAGAPDGQPSTAPAGRGGGRGGGTARLWATTEITVDGRNLSNIVLTLQPSFSIAGRVEFQGTAAQPPAISPACA